VHSESLTEPLTQLPSPKVFDIALETRIAQPLATSRCR
jgi:hypothetical protein